jgi:serine/threonine-protein kinase
MKLGKFEILEEIGRGGFGIVYKARDVTLDRIVALKVLLPEHLGNTNLVEAFKREARHMAKISHPNVIQIYEVGEADDQIYIAMQYCIGGSLEQKLKEIDHLRLQDAIRMLYQVAHGLDLGHQIGLIHRDIKPSNILFNAAGEAAIGDFGISKAVLSTDQTAGHTFNQFSGTPFYDPPELWQGKDLPTPAADIYSLACVFYEAITGEVLFAGDTFVHVLSRHMLEAPVFSDKLPWQLVDVLSVALAKKPEDRYQSMSDFLSAVRQSFVSTGKPSKETDAANVLPGEKFETGEKPTSEDVSFTQIVRRSQIASGQGSSMTPQADGSLKPPINPANQGGPGLQKSDLLPVVGPLPLSGQPGAKISSAGSPSHQQAPRSEAYQVGEKAYSQENKLFPNEPANSHNQPNQNPAGREQRENRKPLFLLLAVALVVVAAIIFGSISIKNNIAARDTLLTLTNLPSATSGATPTSTPMIAVPAGTLKFASMGSVVSGVYQTYPEGGPDNPKWTVSGSDAWNPVSTDEEITLGTNTGDNSAEAIDIQTFGDVGLMLSLGARGSVNSSVFIYGSSDAKLTYTDILEMELRQGTVFVRLESRSEIAQITLPNQQNAVARLTGGSMILHLNGDEVQLWCLKDDCSLDFARESERTFAVQRRNYFPAAGTINSPEDILPAYFDELWTYNIKCNKCMDANIVPEPTPTPTYTSTPWPTNTWQPTNTPKPSTSTSIPVNTATNPPIATIPATATRTNPPAATTPPPTATTPPPPTATTLPPPTETTLPPITYYTVTLISNPEKGGSVSGGGTYPANTIVTIQAMPRLGWFFSGWSVDYAGTDNPHSFTLTGNVYIIANFFNP